MPAATRAASPPPVAASGADADPRRCNSAEAEEATARPVVWANASLGPGATTKSFARRNDRSRSSGRHMRASDRSAPLDDHRVDTLGRRVDHDVLDHTELAAAPPDELEAGAVREPVAADRAVDVECVMLGMSTKARALQRECETLGGLTHRAWAATVTGLSTEGGVRK